MAESILSKPWMQKLIILVVGIVLTILGGYFIGTVISKVLASVDQTMLVAGIAMFVIGIVLLWIIVSKFFKRPAESASASEK